MADTMVREQVRGDAVGSRPRRGLLARFSLAHGLMVLSALLTFVLIATVLSERTSTIEVAVATRDLPAGAVLTAGAVDAVELPADSELASTLLRSSLLAGGEWVTARPVAAGEALRRGDVARGGVHTGLRLMSIPVAREHAVGGALAVGDRVDVIDVVDGQAVWVVRDVQVVAVASGSSSGGIARDVSRDYYLVVEVDADGALALAEALADGRVDIVRSTGAEPIPEGQDREGS